MRFLKRTIIFPSMLFWNRYEVDLNASNSYMLAWHRLGKRKWSALWFKISDLESVSKFFTKCENQNHFVIPGRTSPENFGGPFWPVFLNRPISRIWSLQSEVRPREVPTYEWILCLYWFMNIVYKLYQSQLQLFG